MTSKRALLLVALLLALAGCAAPAEPTEVSLSSTAATAQDEEPAPQEEAPSKPRDTAELRIGLEQLLGQHATLAIRVMRARVDGDEAFADVATDAIATNTEQLTDAIVSVYGAEGGETFEQMWSEHITALYTYTVALVEDDRDGMRAAEATLDDYTTGFAEFLATATGGELAAADVAAGLEMHVDHLTEQVAAYADEDYEQAFALQRTAYEHMFPTGRTVAGGIQAQHPAEFPLPIEDESLQLRSTLGLLLGEHVELAIDAMRAGVRGAPSFEAAAGALNANTEDLTAAMTALFGEETGTAFNTQWADHVEAFVDYTVAVAEGDDDAREEVQHRLHEFHAALGNALSDATGGKLPREAAAEALAIHDDQLVAQIEQYAAEDYGAAYQTSFDAYQHVFDTAAALSSAIDAHLKSQLPVGGAPTGGGGAAGDGHRQHR